MGRSRTSPGPAEDLLIELDRDAGVALHRQIEASIRADVRAGRLRAGTSLPPTRTLAAGLGVSRGVVVEAYQQLVAEDTLSRPGGYTQVSASMSPVPADAEDALSLTGIGTRDKGRFHSPIQDQFEPRAGTLAGQHAPDHDVHHGFTVRQEVLHR